MSVCLRPAGRLFHSFGLAAVKHRFPKLLCLLFLTTSLWQCTSLLLLLLLFKENSFIILMHLHQICCVTVITVVVFLALVRPIENDPKTDSWLVHWCLSHIDAVWVLRHHHRHHYCLWTIHRCFFYLFAFVTGRRSRYVCIEVLFVFLLPLVVWMLIELLMGHVPSHSPKHQRLCTEGINIYNHHMSYLANCSFCVTTGEL